MAWDVAFRTKTIGLLGGMSWESTALYYRLLNEGVKQRLGGLHSAKCVLYSVDFAEIEELQHQGKWEEAGSRLASCAADLTRANIDVLLLCTNTMHLVAGEIEKAIDVPFLHLADATATAIKQAGIGKVGLLGTAFTMEKPFYKDRIASHGIDVLIPEENDRRIVHDVIYSELCLGTINPASRAEYQRIIHDLVGKGAQGVIAGCTEIELLVDDANCPVSLFKTTQIHVEAALDFAVDVTGDEGTNLPFHLVV